MKKYWIAELVLIAALIIYLAGGKVFGQDKPQATAQPTATPTPKIEDVKEKPIIVSKAQIEKSDSLAKDVRIAQLEAEAAIPPQFKARIEAAQKALDEFYQKEIGISREKLSEYEISNGVDGALILRKKAAPAAPEKK